GAIDPDRTVDIGHGCFTAIAPPAFKCNFASAGRIFSIWSHYKRLDVVMQLQTICIKYGKDAETSTGGRASQIISL
ncbi:hypothetical protein LNK15_11980, partial [Jeotgalicoccus huakuii]|nr:hypothetical protein [Jeotgalicoccus huakuii]